MIKTEIDGMRELLKKRARCGCLELTNPTPVRLVHTRPSQITLLEGGARTKVRWHCAAEIGVVRDRQGLQQMRESVRNSLPQVVVIQVKLGERGEGRY